MEVYENLDHQGLHLFYQGTFSNFYAAPFYDDDFYKSVEFVSSFRNAEGRVAFEHVEQYMHACKAVLFNDEQTFARIMREKHPMESKNLGRRVENFSDDYWAKVSRDIVARGAGLKFAQNPVVRDELLSTGAAMLVECAPRDTRWGIGLGKNNERSKHPEQWRGKNWLGQCLTFAKFKIKDALDVVSKLEMKDENEKSKKLMEILDLPSLPIQCPGYK